MKQSALANLILNQYFTHFRCLIILTEHPAYFEYTGKQQIINLSIETSTNNSVFIQDFTTTNYHGCQGFVVDAFKPIEVFEFLEDKIRHSLERFKSRRYFFIINNAENNSDLEFNTEALTYVADVLIMFHKNEDEFEMWTHNYIGLKDMNSLKFLDTWYTKNKSFLYGNDLYPDKLTSQSGRKLTLTCLTYLPYVLCDENKTYDRYYGTEMRATVEYAIAHNMTIDFQYNEHEEELWGELYPNWTGTGVMGIIVLDKADIALASFQTWDFVNPYLDMSAPYLRSSICCLVPRPEDFSGWLIPLLSYSNWLWIAILVNFVFNVVTSALIDFYYEERSAFNLKIFSKSFIKSFWTLLRISMSQVLTKSPSHKYLPLRIVFLVLFLMYLILDSTYFSGLASTMTTPRTHPPINTVAELSLRNIKIYALSDAWKFSIQNADDEVYLVILRNFRTATVEQRELSKQKNNAFMIERLPYNAYAVNEYIQKDVIENYHLMEEDIFWDYSRFYLRKSSILSPSFDRFIMRLTEVGISDRWQTEAIFKFMDSTLQRMMLGLEKQKQTHRDILKLKIYHVKGAFGLLIIGYTIAGVTLLIEKWNSDIFT